MTIVAATAPSHTVRNIMTMIDDQILGFVSSGVASAAAALRPIVYVALCGTFVFWLFIVAAGHDHHPVWSFVTRMTRIVVVTLFALNVGFYNHYVRDLLFYAPEWIAGLYVKNVATSSLLDQALWQGDVLANAFKDQGSGFSIPIWFAMAVFVWIITVVLVGFGAAILALTHFYLGIVLALGPFFIVTLYWKGPRDFWNLWLKQVVTLILTYVLAIMTINLTLRMWQPTLDAASGTVENGMTSLIPVLLIGGLGIYAMRQANMIARGLGGGWHLDLFHVVGSAFGVGWGAVRGGAERIERLTSRPAPQAPRGGDDRTIERLTPIETVVPHHHHHHHYYHHHHHHHLQLQHRSRGALVHVRLW
jgi:type IV secretion system protein VirB6